MDRIDHLIETFRADHPDVDAAVLLEFAGHLRRVLIDELREEFKSGNAPVHISMQVNGASFSAKGPLSYVDNLLAQWQGLSDAAPRKNVTPAFNRMRLLSGPTRG